MRYIILFKLIMRLIFNLFLDSLKTFILALLLTCILFFHVHAADDAQQYMTMGLGNMSCNSFLNESDEGAAYYLSWLAGYMTAYNKFNEETYSILGKTKTIDQIESWLHDYCTVNGDETFESAIGNLMRNLRFFRVKQKP